MAGLPAVPIRCQNEVGRYFVFRPELVNLALKIYPNRDSVKLCALLRQLNSAHGQNAEFLKVATHQGPAMVFRQEM